MEFTGLLNWFALLSSFLTIRSVSGDWREGLGFRSGLTSKLCILYSTSTEKLKWFFHWTFFFLAEMFLLGWVRGSNSGLCISKAQGLSISRGCLQSPRSIAASWKVSRNMIFLSQKFLWPGGCWMSTCLGNPGSLELSPCQSIMMFIFFLKNKCLLGTNSV